jgi:lipid-A-disaccharide synthase-like uncharacterized protein/lauroyl/myristoyl acyltransferase
MNRAVLCLGLGAQALFGGRFLIQWIASERAGKSVVPAAFWFVSLAASSLLLLYAGLRHDPVNAAAQVVSLAVTLWNLHLQRRPAAAHPATAAGAAAPPCHVEFGVVAGIILTSVLAAGVAVRLPEPIPPLWLMIGLIGQFVFSIRFALQVLASERQGKSVMPVGFWYCSIAGSALLLAYACYRLDPVFMLANAPNVFVYVRNLQLIRKDQRRARQAGAGLEPQHRRRARWLGRLLAPMNYAGLLVVCFALRQLPRRWALAVGAGAGFCAYHLRLRRGIVEKNLDYTGLIAPGERRAFTRRLYRTMGRYAADFLAFDERHPPRLVCDPPDALDRVRACSDGRLLISAHFGNWELLGYELRRFVPRLAVVAKPLRNPWVDRWLTRRRERTGVELVLPKDALRQTLRVVEEGGYVAYLIDQYPGRRGTPVPFLGKTALTVRSVAGIAILCSARVMAGYALLEADGSYRVTIEEPPPVVGKDGDRQDAINQHLVAHNQIISRWVEAYPEHWFGWFHRRFKDVVRY